MAKRKENRSRRPKSEEDRRLQAIYAKSRQEFSAADLQKYTVVEKGLSLQKVIAEMEIIQRDFQPKKA